MAEAVDFLRRRSLASGLMLMFLFTWPIDLANAGLLPIQVPFVIYLTLGWGFVFASLLMTGLTQGKGAVAALLKRFLLWRVGAKWHLAAFLLYPAIFGLAVLLSSAWTGVPLDFREVYAHRIFGASASLPVYILPFFLVDLLTNGEEIGWRGYVLPRLQARHSALTSSLIVGVLWGFWHLPRYLAADSTASFGLLMVKTLADAVIYTWLYNNTRGSLLLTSILHATGNTAGVFLPVANTQSGPALEAYIMAIVLLTITAIVITVRGGAEQLSRTEHRQIEHVT